MEIPVIKFEDECKTCGTKQEFNLKIQTIEVKGDPDLFVKNLVETKKEQS